MANQFKVGDVVQLKSGGPKMTVSAAEGKDVWTIWFEGTKQMQGTFPSETLELYQKPAPSNPVRPSGTPWS